MFGALWEFEVKPGYEGRFLSAYGPEGDWVRLFRTDAQFVETRLLKDFADANKFVTIDFWQSRAAYESFKKTQHDEYASLDRVCADLTISERLIGIFEGLR